VEEANSRFPVDFWVRPMRTTWNGSISFGLVNIPVGLAPATAPAARQSDVQFKMLHRTCLTPIRQKRWCPLHDVELGPDEIVRGFEVAKGEFVPIEDAELEAIESHETSRAIGITRFVPAADVDPIYFDRTYYLVPAAAEAQRRPYALLVEAMRDAEVSALGSFVLAGKEKLCLIRTKGETLALETLFVAEDVRSPAEIDEALADISTRPDELALARQIISALEGDFEPGALKSDYRASLRDLLEAKLEGRAPIESAPEASEAPVVDLMEALRASVAATQVKPHKPAASRKRASSRS
jgi:DNA end-binding protein Ku